MNKTIKNNNVASLSEMPELCVEAELKFIACQITVDLFGFDSNSDFIDSLDYVGAMSFFEFAGDLYI